MKVLSKLILMLQFFTRIPININVKASTEDFAKGLIYAPVIGLFIGLILAAVSFGLSFIFPASVSAVLIIVIYIIITGGLHLDGLGDTFDGIFSNRPKERILEIMRDSRVGTNAVLAVFCVLLVDFSVLSQLYSDKYFLFMVAFMPVAGRVGSILGASVSVYARAGEGLGKSFIDYCGKKEFLKGLIIYLLISAGLFVCGFEYDAKMGVLMAIPPISAVLMVKALSRKIGGATGDILGAVCELNQAIFLLCACAIKMI